MKPLACWLGAHDYMRHYTPGHVRLVCTACGILTPGLRGPTTHVEPPIVKRRKLRASKVPVLRIVKTRKTA